MITLRKFRLSIGFALLALATITGPAQASRNIDLSNPAFASVSGLTSIPIGHSQFCKSHETECTANNSVDVATTLTEYRWNELLSVNTQYNADIIPVTDDQLYQTVEFWTYPDGYGDCEDCVIAKRRDLSQKGWNPSTLFITVVRQTSGAGHAVLMARTDRGDLILDNLEGLIKLWNQTPYHYLKRQSQANAGQWVDILDNRSTSTIASL